MARLHEHDGKTLLSGAGLANPRGRVASSAEGAREAAAAIGGPVVVKIQAYVTGRAGIGGVKFAETPDEAAAIASDMLKMKVGAFPVEQVLVEEKIPIKDELFVSVFIDDRERAPAMLVAFSGGSGIEERADHVHRLACDVKTGPDRGELATLLASSPLPRDKHGELGEAVVAIFDAARKAEARSLEVNPLVITADGRVLAADCRLTVDDYAVFRHPELGIEIARELDHPATPLERVAYEVEQADHRGTFYFAKLNESAEAGSKGLIGFHGAGGGGSMMSMDAITGAGFTIANFTDTSGNPSASKVYRAARIILSQPNLVGYFGSGSGVASQEQFWSAYGLAKAFWEADLEIPALIRLGGNAEDRAVEILQSACASLKAPVEGYRKDDSPRFIATRFAELVAQAGGGVHETGRRRVPGFVGKAGAFSFPITGGTVWIDASRWRDAAKLATEHSFGLLRDDAGTASLAVSVDDVKGKDSELIACEVECRRAGQDVVFVDLEIPGLGEALAGKGGA